MALLSDDLSVWEIAFRWAALDPDELWVRIPLGVRDNLRVLISEIHSAHLECLTLNLEKYSGDDPEIAKLHIRHWLHEIEECGWGKRYDRKLLKWARIDRWDLLTWCERHKVPLPEFWFPAGWGLEYEWPDDTPEAEQEQRVEESREEKRVRRDENHRWQMACQQIASVLWARNPTLTIKEVALSAEVQELGGGNNRELETVQGWIKEVDPRDPSKKRGRKRRNNSSAGVQE